MSKGLRTGFIVTGIVVAVLIVGSIIGRFIGWRGTGWGMMGGYGGMWLMPIIMVVFWGLVIWGIVALVRFIISSSSKGLSSQTDSALEILKTRYARGEISKQEYEEKRKDLV